MNESEKYRSHTDLGVNRSRRAFLATSASACGALALWMLKWPGGYGSSKREIYA